MSSELLLILDDASGHFNYSGGEWTRSTLVQWYDKTAFYPEFAGDATQFGSFTITFEGTSIAFIGNTPQTVSAFSQSATVAIDGGESYDITYGDLDPPSYIQWYQPPTLAEGSHTISVDRLAGTAIDFALVNVGEKTSISGRTIFVDDNNPAIHYTGTWARNTNKFITGKVRHGYPAGNTTHRSSTPGDIITFRFSGSSPSVYGIFSWADLGVLSATYSVDGNTAINTLSVTTSTTEYANHYGEASNVLLFSDNTIQPGDHTLVINITECTNQTFMLDYMTYLPSFSSLGSMPNLTNIATSAANASTSTTQPTSTTQSITQSTTASQVNNSGNGTHTKTENDSYKNLTATQTQHVHFVPRMDQQPPLLPVPRRGFQLMNPSQTLFPFHPGLPAHHGSGSAIDLKHLRADFEIQQRSRNNVASPLGTGPQISRGDAQYNSSIPANLDTRNAVDCEPPSYYDGLSIDYPSRRAADNS